MTHPTSIAAPWALRRGAPVLLDGKVACSVFALAFDGGWYLMGGTGGSYDGARLALDCLDPLGRACLRMALAEGETCPNCFGEGLRTGVLRPYPHEGLPCADCAGTGYLRAPAPHHWIGTANEGGTLTPVHAEAAGMGIDELAAVLLVRAAERAVAGLSRIMGLLGGWTGQPAHPSLRVDHRGWLAAGFALLRDAKGRPALLLPDVPR